MIKKLSEIELEIRYTIYIEQKKLNAVRTIIELFNQLDFPTQMTSIENIEELTKLLISLKGKQLSDEEANLVEEIMRE
ncbi:MAG: hypothetical protein L3J20_13635 [Flavobacteriaceae bacterium]|nr:hypothetical protein [Flavobacteriaceae bacterium]